MRQYRGSIWRCSLYTVANLLTMSAIVQQVIKAGPIRCDMETECLSNHTDYRPLVCMDSIRRNLLARECESLH